MKKSLLILMMFVGVGLMLLNSCDGDGDSSIVGTWEGEEMMVMFAAGGVGVATLPDSWTEQLTFNADGSYGYAWVKDGRSGSGTGRWVRENGEIVLTEDGQMESNRYSLNSKYLSIVSTVPAGEAELVYLRQ